MKTMEVKIRNKLGLHARAAAKLVSTASHFEADLTLEKSGQQVNGKSIMGVMMLAASMGSTIKMIAHGPDEDAALDALSTLIEDRFEEPE